MLALMARTLRWARSNSQVQVGAGSTGADLDFQAATTVAGETYTRIIFNFQMLHDRPGSLVGAWSIIGTVGIIESDAGATAPPARPLSNPNADWIWLESMIWTPAQVTFTSTGAAFSNLQECSVQNRSIRAQRMANAGGSKLWVVHQWQPALFADAVMRRRLWLSVGILEP